ncbi:MAG: serine hydrolase domain-containing protein, partial [Bacteroidota bacterium]
MIWHHRSGMAVYFAPKSDTMINRTLFLLLSLFIFASLHVYAQPGQEVDGEAITALLNRYTDDDSPGMAVGVVKDGEVVYEHYLGLANLDHQIRFDENTCTNIASTAKQFTALMILELSMEGKLDLEDDIRKYLPTLYPHIESDIKIRHLINHTSGIRDYVFILEMMDRPYWQQVGMRNSGVIELLEKQEELAFEPGSKYGYSNSGYTILAIIIEEVTGESFNDYSDAFFQKMGMSNTSFLRRYMGVIPNRADSYSD